MSIVYGIVNGLENNITNAPTIFDLKSSFELMRILGLIAGGTFIIIGIFRSRNK